MENTVNKKGLLNREIFIFQTKDFVSGKTGYSLEVFWVKKPASGGKPIFITDLNSAYLSFETYKGLEKGVNTMINKHKLQRV